MHIFVQSHGMSFMSLAQAVTRAEKSRGISNCMAWPVPAPTRQHQAHHRVSPHPQGLALEDIHSGGRNLNGRITGISGTGHPMSHGHRSRGSKATGTAARLGTSGTGTQPPP